MYRARWLPLVWLLIGAAGANGQEYPVWGQAPLPPIEQPSPRPDQPIIPDTPILQRRPARPDADAMGPPVRGDVPPITPSGQPAFPEPGYQPLVPPAGGAGRQLPYPFNPPLTRQEEDDLQRLLVYWEQSSANVKTFECKFARHEFEPDPTGRRKPDEPKASDGGEIKYAAPDKAMFRVNDNAGEYWVCDGKALYTLDAVRKQMRVQKLPPELQGKAIADGPVPFLFGAKAAKMQQRYYLRIIPPDARRAKNEVWLEAWPRYMSDAQNFKSAELALVIGEKSLTPKAVRIHHPNGNSYMVFILGAIAVRDRPSVLGGVFEDAWWRPHAPSGWQTVVEEPPQVPQPAQPPASRQPPARVGIRFHDPR